MGSACSSKQNKDSDSNNSNESPTYDKGEGGDKLQDGKDSRSYSQAAGYQEPSVPVKKADSAAPVFGGHGPLPAPLPAHHSALASVSESMSPQSPAPDLSKQTALQPPPKDDLISALLAAASTSPKPSKVVLFICAADSQDCKLEKSMIHREVYPGLREMMREKNFTLEIVDLCWSVHEKTPEPADLVLHELHRQSETGYIVPVLLMNQWLGAPLVPRTMEPADLETAKQSDLNNILAAYYFLDSMAEPPCYRLKPPATLIPNLKSENKEEREAAIVEWRNEVDKILSVFLNAFSTELRDTYLSTLVEQEVDNTILMSEVLAKRCVWLSRMTSELPQNNQSKTPAEIEAARRLDALQTRLKKELSENHMHRIVAPPLDQNQASYLEQVISLSKKNLINILESIVSNHSSMKIEINGIRVPPSLVEEVSVQSHWAKRSSQCSANRQQLLQQLVKNYGTVNVLIGEEGWGKTTLVSRLSESCPRVVLSSANLTKRSSTIESILHHILLQLNFQNQPPYLDLDTYKKLLPDALEVASKEAPLILIIDGIDQYREFGSQNSVTWIPKKLPDNCKLILTVTENSSMVELLKNHLGSSAEFIKVPPLDEKEAEGLVISSIMEYNHSIQPDVQEAVLESLKQSTNPLYLKVLAWQTSWCNEYDHKLKPMGNLRKQINTMFSDLEAIFGKEKVENCLSLLTAAKWGLLDSEMIDLLASNELYHTSKTYLPWAGALLFWSRLHKELRPFLRTCPGTGLISWWDSTFRSVATARYSKKLKWAHSTIATYFKGDLWKGKDLKSRIISQPNRIGDGFNQRKLEELPHAVFKSTGSCSEYLLDHSWLLDKLSATSVFQVQEDWRLEGKPEWLGTLLKSPGLEYDSRQLYTQLSTVKEALPAEWKLLLENPPIPSLIVLNKTLETSESKDKQFDIVQRLPDNANFVVTVISEKEEISVWNIKKCEKVRTLQGVPQPLSLEMIDNFRCVVLCKRELRVYDLDKGVLLSKLKGVMNQKMPYFGLHGNDHLVALSRNRMYVNLMNIETGDLVTTFKAGEDRFLNSLLVSGDGRMLVCGDETQKPFPLLVWNLASRKLLYDLRIPGHDFITNLSAITHQGHYVCCVAKEVDEPSPNFIVVYDLQSGTLFKKWKPGVDCVSVDISSRHTCVVSGHVDGTILIWDLVTGNCRWTLTGHTAPVKYLRLDASSCLSMDAKSTDVRLWDLSSGALFAVYTVDGASKVSCCEVTHGGRLVAIASQAHPHPVCLELRHSEQLKPLSDDENCDYGEAENHGKVFTVSEEVR